MNLQKVKKELEAAVNVTREKGEELQVYLARLIREVNKLDDKDFDKLTDDAMDWQNDNIQRLNNKKQINGFGDEEADEPATPARRRRAAEADAEAETEAVDPDPKVGDFVVVVCADGAKLMGEVTSIDDKYLTLVTDDGEEDDIKRKNIKSIKVRGSAGPADEQPTGDAALPNKGDMCTVEMLDGKKHKGEFVEQDEKYITILIDGEEESFKMGKVAGVLASATTKPAATPARRSRAAAGDDDPPARGRGRAADADAAGKAPRALKGEDGETDVKKAWKLMSEHLDDTFEQAKKRVAKAGLDVKDATLTLRYRDLQQTYVQFKELGLIKTAR